MVDFIVNGENEGIIKIKGDITVQNVNELKNAILNAFDAVDNITLDMAGVSSTDIASIQLICATHQTSILMNKNFRFGGNISKSFYETILNFGYLRCKGCERDTKKTCLWTEGEN